MIKELYEKANKVIEWFKREEPEFIITIKTNYGGEFSAVIPEEEKNKIENWLSNSHNEPYILIDRDVHHMLHYSDIISIQVEKLLTSRRVFEPALYLITTSVPKRLGFSYYLMVSAAGFAGTLIYLAFPKWVRMSLAASLEKLLGKSCHMNMKMY